MYDSHIVVTPVIGAASFSANDFVGGVLTLDNYLRSSAGLGILTSLVLVDKSKQAAALTVFFFGKTLAGSYADNGAEAITAADWLKCIGFVDVLASDYKTLANASVVSLNLISLGARALIGAPIYALIVTTGTPTYAANALQLTFGFDRGEGL